MKRSLVFDLDQLALTPLMLLNFEPGNNLGMAQA